MALGSRDILYFFMGIIAVGLVVFFSAYELTTYESVRDSLGSIALETSQAGGLQTQYDIMDEQFRGSQYSGIFTYHYGMQDIDITGPQARDKTRDQVLGLVLDKYATNFYNGNVPGSLSTVSGLVGAGATASTS